jgi:hypothetical protein
MIILDPNESLLNHATLDRKICQFKNMVPKKVIMEILQIVFLIQTNYTDPIIALPSPGCQKGWFTMAIEVLFKANKTMVIIIG